MSNDYLDDQEKELIESFELENKDNLKAPTTEEQNQLKTAANAFIKQEKKMNIRIDAYELDKIKERAAREGLRYQTFVKSILHKYLTGQLVEKN